jgi:hypothetical protein
MARESIEGMRSGTLQVCAIALELIEDGRADEAATVLRNVRDKLRGGGVAN